MSKSRLRPSKIRSAVRRRAFEKIMPRESPDVGMEVDHLGTYYGGWLTPRGVIDSNWTCWSVGAGGDVSFDAELVKRYGVRVRAFDPVAENGTAARTGGLVDEPLWSFHHLAVALADAPIRMQTHQQHESSSLTAVDSFYEGDGHVLVPGRTIESLRRELGDPRIDLLKLDVEGLEYDLVPSLDLDALGVQILMVEGHHHRGIRAARDLFAHLRAAGFEFVGMAPHVKTTWIRSMSGNAVQR